MWETERKEWFDNSNSSTLFYSILFHFISFYSIWIPSFICKENEAKVERLTRLYFVCGVVKYFRSFFLLLFLSSSFLPSYINNPTLFGSFNITSLKFTLFSFPLICVFSFPFIYVFSFPLIYVCIYEQTS